MEKKDLKNKPELFGLGLSEEIVIEFIDPDY